MAVPGDNIPQDNIPTDTAPNENAALKATGATGQTSEIEQKVDFSALAPLAGLNGCLIKQPLRGKELFWEMCCGIEMSNKYEIYSINSETRQHTQMFTIRENSNFFLRQMCGAARPLVLKGLVPPNDDDEAPSIFMINKPYRMGMFCCPATSCVGRSYMELYVGGVLIGSIQEQCLCACKVKYTVHDHTDEILCSIERFACACECGNIEFQICTPDGAETGFHITKTFDGLWKEIFTDMDNFLVDFPEFMSTLPRKLLLIAAGMMIEFRHFEKPADQN